LAVEKMATAYAVSLVCMTVVLRWSCETVGH
jgi:hypothetical protein